MEERKNLLDYLTQIILIFGITLLVITGICFLVGEDAREYSTMFALGSKGIPINTIWQYLMSSACIAGLRFLFFSDSVFKKMSITRRTIGMVISVIVLIGMFAYGFGWFPVNEPKCWMIFLVCFGICFVISAAVSIWKENTDNKQLSDGLKNLKEGKDGSVNRSK
ncbi:MAG: hypothetical protein J1E83_06390 [Lachnospiraceae bacterium]|nr:hypothetical protein [Lachnospiraceae bacterium]